ncbi:hypothetical protein GGR57DRAFT_437178 [Xylariaceae sp. FL1272]|nr:hypothetical protein GGR57DRAFT_437178 [Xylariaceae sp. FL1272]
MARGQGHQRINWGPHKRTLWRLYVKQKKPLPEVKRMMEASGLKATNKQYRYQLGDKWGWKKYGQTQKPKKNLADEHEGQTETESDTEEGLQQITYRGDLLARLMGIFNGHTNATLSGVIDCNDRKNVLFVQEVFVWCKMELRKQNAHVTWSLMGFIADDEGDADDVNSKVLQWTITIFVFLFDRLATSSDVAWCESAEGDLNACPVQLLRTMASLIVRVAMSGLCRDVETGQKEVLLGERTCLDTAFMVAKRGVSYIDNRESNSEWHADYLAKNFADELRQPTNYSIAKVERIVQRYVQTRHIKESPVVEPGNSFDEIWFMGQEWNRVPV